MDLSTDSGTLPPHTTVRGPMLGQELSLSNARCQTESGGTISLHLLGFKTHLLEAVEELHIRRDAETRFEDQISKLVLEKQELEWEKESLQRQIETVANQHTESILNVKKKLQAKIRNTVEEKGKYQVSAEIKDKEINNLKDELKTLQLLKYNLEKKSSELEVKLALQTRSKDSHLNQLGEVEKRFSALSRQCAVVKQAHEKLEQNVDEAMKINKKMTTACEKQEATIVSLKKEVEEVSNKLIKAKMSSVRHDQAQSPTGREQHFQQLHQKLNMETEMNKKLREENEAVRAEKQEVMRAMQHAQQLLLCQTQTVSRVDLEMKTQREQQQALKQEHRAMREKSKALEDKVARLMESYMASQNSWDKEKAIFLGRIRSEQQELQAVKEANDELHQKNTELSSQASVQAQHREELEMRDISPSHSDSTEVFSTLVKGIRGEETLNEPISSAELSSGSVQHLASTQTRYPDCLEDSGAATEIVTTGATGVVAVSSPVHRSIDVSVDSQIEEGERNEEEQCNREEVQGEKRGTLMAQTTDRADGREDSLFSTEDAGDPKQPETETKDIAEGEETCGAEERGKTGLHTAETQIRVQATTDTTIEKSNTQQVVDSMDAEPPLTDCETSDCSHSLPQTVSEKDADCSHVKKEYETRKEGHLVCSDEHQSLDLETNVNQQVQRLGHDEVQTFAESLAHPSSPNPVFEKKTEEKISEISSANKPTDLSVPLAAQLDGTVSIQDSEQATTQASKPSDITRNMKLTDEIGDTPVREECVLVTTEVEQQALPQSQDTPEQNVQLKSPVANGDDDGDSNACKKKEDQSNAETLDNIEAPQDPLETSNLKDACADITMETVDLESQVETLGCREQLKNDKIEDAGDAKMTTSKTDLKLFVHQSHGSNALPGNSSINVNEMLHEGTSELSLPSNRTYRSSLDWAGAKRKNSEASTLHPSAQVKRAVHTAAGLLSCQTEDTSCIGADDASDDSQVLEAHTTKRGQSVTVATQTEPLEPCPCKTVTLVSVQTGTDDINNSQLLSHDHPYCVSRDIAGGSATLAPADAMAKAPPSPTPDVSMPEEDASSSGESIPGTEPSSSDYSPTEDDIIQNDSEDSEDDGEHSVDGGEDPVSDKKYLVSHAQLMKLFCVCNFAGCGKCVISRPYCSAKGFGLTVKTDCIDDHEFVWTSQPLLNGTMSCNLLVPAAIFLTGNAYGPFSEICQCLGLESLSTRHCYNIQRVYVLPEVTSVWNLHNEAVMAATGDQVVTMSGDGRCDSPGHCATFGTYTMLDINSRLIIAQQTVKDHNVTISILATDCHPAVQKMLREDHKTIKHEFDLWHIVKGVKKRMLQSRNTELKEWVRMVSNHLWYCVCTCDGDALLLKEKWTSILHHIINVHEWLSAEKMLKCEHEPYSEEDGSSRPWLERSSKAFGTLQKVVMDKRLLKNLDMVTEGIHTGELESIHSLYTKYVPKRKKFTEESFQARLAALDHNHNIDREQVQTKKGALQFKLQYSKPAGGYVGSPMSEQNTSDSSGLRHCTIPLFLKSKRTKVPLVISRASDLLNASSVSGTAASTQRQQQGERKDSGETCKETANMGSRASLSTTSFPVNTAVSRLSWQNTPGCSRAPTSAAGPSTDGDLSCSQEREDQQASFRTQIFKIEQFLNTERLRLPKRRKTDN
ncbi:coiled-coil domain-containing protein 73-like [Gymnodraco acuticeps]|uniref:Coiled-coil domain-containing protein 73-like n=1 Tax=Gymnodraco acuticeps TaxID=8218 RepID=A0A6P8X3L5_GYMAC|nr:coiled-coil domain-containing protein 73-like [Gymnodraco acuticeps]